MAKAKPMTPRRYAKMRRSPRKSEIWKKKRRLCSEKDGPFCGRMRAHGKGACKNYAGFKTDHPGEGACFKHGGRTANSLKHGRYSSVTHRQVRETLDTLTQMQEDAMDLIPEANLLRAMLIDYVNRYDEFVEALMAWYADPDNKMRPRRSLDITDAAGLAESISRIVHRMHQIQSEGAISLITFARVTEQMGITVARYVKDKKTLEQIQAEWQHLALDAKTPPTADDGDSGSEEDED